MLYPFVNLYPNMFVTPIQILFVFEVIHRMHIQICISPHFVRYTNCIAGEQNAGKTHRLQSFARLLVAEAKLWS